jgi:hypothetical protein
MIHCGHGKGRGSERKRKGTYLHLSVSVAATPCSGDASEAVWHSDDITTCVETSEISADREEDTHIG